MKRRVCSREVANGGGSHCLLRSGDLIGKSQGSEPGLTLEVQRQEGCQSDLQCWSWERSLGSKEDGVAWLSSRGTCQGSWRESQSTDESSEPEPWAGERQRQM